MPSSTTDSSAVRSSQDWQWMMPTVAVGAFILAMIALVWLLQKREFEQQMATLARDVQWAEQTLRLNMQSDQEYLQELAHEVADGQIDGAKFQARASTLPVIFITGHGDVPMAVAALKKGAADFIEKPFSDQDMVGLIEACMQQDRADAARRAENASLAQRRDSLTQREQEVLARVVAGKLNKQIADELGISIKTVEVHRSRVMQKMGANSVAELVQLSLKKQG